MFHLKGMSPSSKGVDEILSSRADNHTDVFAAELGI